jgi:zinc transporter ZupT
MTPTVSLYVAVFVAGLLTMLATGLGPLALFWQTLRSTTGQALSLAGAAGLMLLMSVWLIIEAADASWAITACGFAIGAGATTLMSSWSHRLEARQQALQPDTSDDARPFRLTWLTIVVLTAHSAAEGVAVGVAPAGGWETGILVTLGMAVHNIPEGLAIGLVALPAGMSMRRAIMWSILSSAPQPLIAVPAFALVNLYPHLAPLGLAVAAGAMGWLCLGDLLPEAIEKYRQAQR